MKIFLTGGTGFIGKSVVKVLKNEDLLILTHSSKTSFPKSNNHQLVFGTLADINKWKSQVKKFKPDATIHMAWEGIPDYGIKQSLKNLSYGLTLYDFLAQINCRTILTAGSCWEYGGQIGKLSESVFPKPFNAFTAAKTSLNLLGNEIAKTKEINFIWARLFYVYGPGQRGESLIPYLINCIKSNKIPEIKNPDAKNDFIYVDDIAEAICKLVLSCKKSDIFNIGSGKLTSVQDIMEIIFKYFKSKKRLKKIATEEKNVLSSFYADTSKIEKKINWLPKIGIEEGVNKVINSII